VEGFGDGFSRKVIHGRVSNFKFQIPSFNVILNWSLGFGDCLLYFKYWGAKLVDSGLFEKAWYSSYENVIPVPIAIGMPGSPGN
jgi:hypothetical protein